ncbi:acyltransferase family protein [Macrococcus armenti]|uniref:acyltransferase family protein n=1 Tax=Macrococcus armenti TaxID=2875764 RepID=UPI001CCFB91F|nr:acyltransferase family protein [Macrococcus armenti]UBH15479.1 acyltransferase [Macrococcus armenti]UBH17839.1 acyltransferase [Macrococcus armenti]UBH20104.1 acyltransferase [Macrococcus armenti]
MNRKYLPGLDGIRAIAVIAIIIFHLNPKWLPGGFLGVDTFFVISGYLIAMLLLNEYEQTGTINIVQFWIRRVKRLFPPALFMLLVVIQYIIFFDRDLLYQLKKDAIAAFLYVSNWWYIFDGLSYFESFEPRPLQHLWSLAIEEQFYLCFPLLLMLLLKRWSKKQIFIILLIVSLISSIWMSVLYDPAAGNVSRVYFGTDTRLQTLLIGVMFAFIWPAFKLKQKAPILLVLIIEALGISGLCVLMYCIINASENSALLFNGGFYVISIFTLFMIMSAVHPNTLMRKVLGIKPLVVIGKYSYSLYLWHYPVIVLMQAHFVKGQIPIVVHIASVIVTVMLAVLSYKLIEHPYRTLGFKVFTKIRPIVYFITILITLYLCISTPYLLSVVKAAQPMNDHLMTKTISNVPSIKRISPLETNESVEDIVKHYTPLLIGDSLLVDINDKLKEVLPNATIDGEVGRNIYKTLNVADKYKSFNHKDSIIILFVGTNGDFQDIQMNILLSKFDKAEVFLVTSRVPKEYEQHVNEEMYKAERKYKNVHIIDWYEASKAHTEYFAPDGIHLEYPGVERMVSLIHGTLVDHENNKN